MADYAIGVDLGGTNLRAAAIGRDGKVLSRISGRAQLREGREAVVGDMVSSIETLAAQLGAGNRLAGIGVAVAGFIRIEEGIIVGSNNLPEFEGYALRDDLEGRLKARVILENDANAAALGEKWCGAGRDVQDLVLLTLGTGIGGGIVADGRILHGCAGMAGEVGHTTVLPNGNPCGCGNQGCLEKHASATAIASMARVMLGSDLTSEEVYKLAVGGDDRARRIFELMGSYLGIALANLVNIFNFPLYLLSGGPLPAWDLFAPTMMDEVKRRSFTFRHARTRIEKAVLGNEAGLFGAAYLPFLSQKNLM